MSGLRMKQMVHSFGDITVLNGVNFHVQSGEVHALLGMNGAGKSTLMNILAGVLQPTGGTIEIDGQLYTFSSPKDAKRAGIGHVVQEVDAALFPALSVYENVLAEQIVEQPNMLFSKTNKRAFVLQLLERVGLAHVSLDTPVQTCSLHEKQLILLARVLSSSARYIILDEPTASLSEEETKRLFAMIEQLKVQGVSFIYISHKLHEVKRICDRMTILRDGTVVYEGDVSLPTEQIVRHMVGRQPETRNTFAREKSEETIFEVKQLYIPKTKTTVDLAVRRGEIVGIAGLVGAGKTELAESMIAHVKTTGERLLHEKKQTWNSPKDAIEAGVCLIPEERRKQGLFMNETIEKNLTVRLLSNIAAWQWIQKRKERALATRLISSLRIRPSSPNALVKHLSGGNQQKVVIGKWLQTNSDVLIFDEPTKGIDAHAKEEVFSIIRTLAEKGKAIIYLTSECQELLHIADTIYVMVDGQLIKQIDAQEATYEQLVYDMTGGGTN
ncbi:sugar ABC transporter [Anoxybacillus flavithermus]|uniref:Autoinducer 2 import ATP-binding protein LsrA n=1 Tax=Anoxybacillus flavithermus TaxID=33934 RepID=A0A2G5RU78_9BACL|nr:sugar ABC transporter ATP-binding protein [Anoxybacillus flavithermus]PIC06345.1 sugar ABC transporter [Anoxybacillus flavithermus]